MNDPDKKSKIDVSRDEPCNCERLPEETKWQYVKSTEDGMGSLFKCRYCGKEILA